MSTYQQDIRGVMIAIANGYLLLPNASVAEVITYSQPVAYDNVPEWVLGRLVWRGWQIPLFSFSTLVGLVESENTDGAKVAVVKALNGNPKMPFISMLTQGFPRLTTITADTLETADEDEVVDGMHSVVTVREERAYIPDLDRIEDLLGGVLSEATVVA